MSIELKSENFGEYYYLHDCGNPYERSEQWLGFFNNIAERIVKELEPKSVLDAGCAWGFLVEALRSRGVEAWGVDVSKYAISNVHESIKDYCKVGSIVDPFECKYDLIVNIEVLEHMQTADAVKAIGNFCNASDRVLFSSTPFDYTEATHINVQSPEYWSKEFALQGFYKELDFDGSYITPWTSLFTKQNMSKSQLLTNYERKYWFLQKENVDLRQRSISDQSICARLESKIAATEQELNSLLKKNAELEQSIKFANNEIVEYYSSTSWKITKPFRWLSKKLKGKNA